MECKYSKLDEFMLSNKIYYNIEFEYYYNNICKDKKTILILHALTFDSSLFNYWNKFMGKGKLFDTDQYNIICITSLGNASGSFGPNSKYAGKRLGEDFPKLNIDDLADFQVSCLKKLGITNVDFIVGKSLGGIVGWNMISRYHNLSSNFIMIGSLNKVGIEMYVQNTIALDVLNLDLSSNKAQSLKLCRKMAMIQYQTFEKNFMRFDASNYNSYLEHNANKFTLNFDYVSYKRLIKAINKTSREDYLKNVWPHKDINMLMIGITQDRTFYVGEQLEFVKKLKEKNYNISYELVDDISGHDSFLISNDKYEKYIYNFLNRNKVK